MRKRFGSTIRIIVALFLSVFMTNFAPVMTAYADAPGNNGTVKIDNEDIDGNNGDNDNNPHVGCSFEIEWFGYDAGPRTSQVTFEAQAPTAASQLVSPIGAQTVNFTGAGGPGSTLDHTQTFTLAFTGAPQTNQGYHVKVTVNTDGSKGNDKKSKVFWVEDCEATKTPVIPAAPSFDDQCGKRNDTYTITPTTGVIYKVNSQTVTGTNSGSGTVTVTAEAETGYVLAGGTYSWEFNFTNVLCPISVTPKTPHHVNPCGTAHDFYTIPHKTGVVYKANGNPVSAGLHTGTGTVVITAHPAASHYQLTGTTTWTFNFTDVPCVSVEIISDQPCVERGAITGEVTVNVTNNQVLPIVFRTTVDSDSTNAQTELIAPGQTYTFTFSGFGPGTYDVMVEKLVFGPFSLAPPAATVEFDMTDRSVFPNLFRWETVFQGETTITECPVDEPETPPTTPPGQVLGDSTPTGQILSTSTNVPSTLPVTGGSDSQVGLLPIVIGVITYLIVDRKVSRKRLEA